MWNFYYLNDIRMKKLLEWWRLWTLLSALMFFMMCWMFVYAVSWDPTSSSLKFTSWKTSNNGNVLTAADWDNLMTKLDVFTVPQGAIVAFYDRTTCPTWWKKFDDAAGRFLMGQSSSYVAQGWNAKIYLKKQELPQHQHYIRMAPQGDFWDDSNARPVVVDWDTRKFPAVWQGMSNHNWEGGCYDYVNGDWSMKCASDPAANTFTNNWKYGVKTSPDIDGVYDQKQVDIMNPYLQVLFCQKL